MNEVFSQGILTTVIGMGSVFTILVLLSFSTAITARVVDFIEAPRAKKVEATPVVAATPVVVASAANEVAQTEISGEIIAAITAAIVASTGRPAETFRFTAIRRVNTGLNPWANAGNQDIINTRIRYIEGGVK